MWRVRAHELACLAAAGLAAAAEAQTRDEFRSTLTVRPSPVTPAPPDGELLQLEVFVNDQPTNLVAAFRRRSDGSLAAAPSELREVGLKVPAARAAEAEVPLAALPGVTFVYEESRQAIRFTAAGAAQLPTVIEGHELPADVPPPQRPPFGATVNYTLFASADEVDGDTRFEGLAGSFETRVFGRFGLLENGFVARSVDRKVIRLDSAYIYQDPRRLMTFQAGDAISGGFAWTRPIRLAGLQVRRSFGLRPDLITYPLPVLSGTAAAPSTLDLLVNEVRTLSTNVPQGPYQISHPPLVYGSGIAQVVVRDALGREAVTQTPFYAAPDLLAPGLSDFSVELGFARRSFGTLSSDYDDRLAFSASYRRGMSENLTLLGHAEGTGSFQSAGAGAAFTIGSFGLGAIAAAGSRAPEGTGALVDLSFESRTANYSLTLRMQRTFGDYEDLASQTASGTFNLSDRRIFGQPAELEQAVLSLPLPWGGSSLGLGYAAVRRANGERARIANASYTQDFGRLSFFATAVTDFELNRSTSLFVGLSLPLGRGISGSAGATHGRGRTSAYIEASRQGAHHPGAWGWSVRATDGEEREAHAIVRYDARFARFEGAGLYADGDVFATLQMEGALTFVGGGLHATQRLNNSFALVDVGAPGVAVMRENRPAGVTNRAGKLLVPDLAPFSANRIEIDPAALPIDAKITATHAVANPFSRSPALVDLRVATGTGSALIQLLDPAGSPIELGAAVRVDGGSTDYVVGYDGMAFVDGLTGAHRATVTPPTGKPCEIAFRYVPAPGEQVRIGPLRCLPVER